jgi:phage regulator Rha-like protein
MAELLPQLTIESKILLIRGNRVMLDRDLAELYGVETKNLNRATKRNAERFPDDFMFQLNAAEANDLSRFQIGTLKRGQNIKYLPYAFTELGVAMLSSVLNSQRAIEINIKIMRAFVRLREVISENKALHKAIAQVERRLDVHDRQIQIAFAAIKSMMQPPVLLETEKAKKKMGFGKE